MPTRRFLHTANAEDAGRRLDVVAAGWLPAALARPVSKSTVRRLIMAGVVRVNGRPSRRPGAAVEEGERLEAEIDEARLPAGPTRDLAPRLVVLYEDEALVAVAKPPGLPMHATADPSRPDLYALVQRQLAASYLGLHQRLDRDTSGIVVFTKSPAANSDLARSFEEHAIEKVYHALTVAPRRRATPRWSVSGRLQAAGRGKRSRTRSVGEGGAAARTDFAVLEDLGSVLLVEARPLTGRKHQVRAHLAECGAPILGDRRYGGPSRVGDVLVRRSMLHARRLILRHPITSQVLRLECPYPDDFRDILSLLARHRPRAAARRPFAP